MDPVILGAAGMAVMLILIAIRVPIAFSLGVVAIVCIYFFFAFPAGGSPQLFNAIKPSLTLATNTIFDLFQSYDLTAIPMFIALGHVAYRAGITSEIYFAARSWLTRVPGGLAMASVIGCGGFSAISGSSLACAATMGRVAVPEMLKFGYSDRLATGVVAAGGTLGSLIPPSILFIIYGIFAEESISKLFIAGIVPGIISMIGYWLVIAIWTTMRPKDAPRTEQDFTLRDRFQALVRSWPAIIIFLCVIGGIYGGVFTATEAASVSLIIVSFIGLASKRINWAGLLESIREAIFQSAAIFLIAGAAKVFVTFISLTGLAHSMLDYVQAMDPNPAALLIGVAAIYIILGMFLDPLGIMLLTLPFAMPLMENAGYDLIWFGVIVVKLLEMGLITPPVGLNVFVINSVTEPKIPVSRIFAGVAPFFLSDLVVLALLLAFPAVTLWLTTAL